MRKKVAVVGCGLIAEKKHVPAFKKLNDKVEIVAVCDLNENLAIRLSRKFKIKKHYSDIFNMLAIEKPDIVNVCTPPQTHAKLATLAIEHGAHIVIEKPMALSVSDCETIIRVAKQHNKQVGIIHNQLFNPAFIRAKKIVDSGELGEFVGMQIFLSTPTNYITSIENHWAHKLPGGILGETGPHSVYLACSFLKDIYDVNINAKKILHKYKWSQFEDFRFNLIAKNGICSVTQIYSTNQWAASFNIFCENGLIKVDLENRLVLKYKREKLNPLVLGKGVLDETIQRCCNLFLVGLSYLSGSKIDPHYVGIDEFVQAVSTNKSFSISANEGREVVRIMEMLVNKLERSVETVTYSR